MDKSRIFKWVAIALVCGSIAYPWYLSATDYCFKEEKYFTDEEYIAAAVRHNVYDMKIDGSEESIKNFYITHPTCCSVNRSSHMASSWRENFLGWHYVEVELNYEKNQKN